MGVFLNETFFLSTSKIQAIDSMSSVKLSWEDRENKRNIASCSKNGAALLKELPAETATLKRTRDAAADIKQSKKAKKEKKEQNNAGSQEKIGSVEIMPTLPRTQVPIVQDDESNVSKTLKKSKKNKEEKRERKSKAIEDMPSPPVTQMISTRADCVNNEARSLKKAKKSKKNKDEKGDRASEDIPRPPQTQIIPGHADPTEEETEELKKLKKNKEGKRHKGSRMSSAVETMPSPPPTQKTVIEVLPAEYEESRSPQKIIKRNKKNKHNVIQNEQQSQAIFSSSYTPPLTPTKISIPCSAPIINSCALIPLSTKGNTPVLAPETPKTNALKVKKVDSLLDTRVLSNTFRAKLSKDKTDETRITYTQGTFSTYERSQIQLAVDSYLAEFSIPADDLHFLVNRHTKDKSLALGTCQLILGAICEETIGVNPYASREHDGFMRHVSSKSQLNRSLDQIYWHMSRRYNAAWAEQRERWTDEDDTRLLALHTQRGAKWKVVK